MNLTLNGRFLQRRITGVERLALELSRAIGEILSESGAANIDVVVPARGDIVRETAIALGTPGPVITATGRFGGQLWEQVELPKERPDAWLLSLCNIGPMIRRRQAVIICDAQFILHPKSYSIVFRLWYRFVLTVLSRRAEAVFTISEFSKSQLERYGIVPQGKAHVLKLGVDHLFSSAYDHGVLSRHGLKGKRYLFAIGSLAPHKNLAMLVEAFRAAALQDVCLVIAGGGNAKVFRDAGLAQAPNIHYLGRVSDAELHALYSACLAFACPSLSEGFGFTPLEAMKFGRPVVATTGGAVPEVCGDAALYADPSDPAAWSDALRNVVENDALREKLGTNALVRVKEFRWRDTAAQFLSVLRSLDRR